MISARFFLPLVPIAVIVCALSGCAPAVPSHTHARPAASSPAPTPTTANAPGSRVPIGCADLLGTATVQALAGANATVERDEDSAPTNILSIAQVQYGAEDCVWNGEDTGGGTSPGAYLTVTVAPDAASTFASRFDSLMAVSTGTPPHPTATENVAGDRSGYWCANELDILGADAPSLTCDAEMLEAGYWVSVDVGDVSGLTRSQLTGGLSMALRHIASVLKAAGAPPLKWVSAITVPPGSCTASPGRVSASTIGLTGREFSCVWTSASYGSQNYVLLTGGSWALPTLRPIAPSDADYGANPYVSTTVAGAAAAKVSCGDGTCDAYLAIGTSAVEIVYSDPGAAADPALLAGLVTAVTSS